MADFRVILVDPLYEGNVGHVARSMMNFGITDLSLVQGCSIGQEGEDRAVHAQAILQNAPRHDSLDAATEGCDLVVGFTARMTGRERNYRRNPVDLRDWAAEAASFPGRIALVFGREDRGLQNEETDRCDVLVAIPTHDMYRSMNLSHAVTVVGYALYAESRAERVKEYTPATPEQVERIHVDFGRLLEASRYPPHRAPVTVTMFRRLIGRARPTSYEAVTFLGVLRKALWACGVGRGRRVGELADEPDVDAIEVTDLDALAPPEA